jgi:D-sedoheptulose 7-phosphate isomerase
MTISETLISSITLKQTMLENKPLLQEIQVFVDQVVSIYKADGKLLIGGNGGSAADAQHFAAEITCQYELKRSGKSALALHTDTSALTAWSNDYSFEDAYARLVEAHGRRNDGLFLISTSGNSRNLIQAAKRAIRVVGS